MIAKNKNNNILTCHSSQQEEQTIICFSNQTLLHYLTSCSPSPHSRWCASPHGWWRGHPARGGQPARGRAHGGSQHSCDRDLLTVDLTWMGGKKKKMQKIKNATNILISEQCVGLSSHRHCTTQSHRTSPECTLFHVHVPPRPLTAVHVFQGLLRLLGRLKLHVGVAFGQVRVDAVHGHVNHLDLAIDGEDLLDVLLQRHEAKIVLKFDNRLTYFT